MKKTLLIVGGLVVLAGITAAAVFLPKRGKGTEVYVAKVEAGKVTSVVSANGEIQPRTKVNISSNVWGQIIGIPVKEGNLVKKGDVLVRIDPTQYESQVRSLEASLRMAHVGVEQEENRNRTLQAQYKRAEGLRSQQILDEQSYDDARLAFDSSTISLKSLKESVEQATASLQKARDDLGKTTIYAPMDGKVTALNTEVGEQVIVGTTNVPGSVIMVISDMSEVLAEVDVDETEIVRVAVNQPAKVSVDAVEKQEYHGRVSEIRNSARKKQDVNVFGVKIQVDDPDERLRPGMSARARIAIEERKGVLRVPIQAVLEKTRKQLDDEIAKASTSKSGSARKPEAKVAKAASGEGTAAEKGGDGSAAGAAGASGGKAGGQVVIAASTGQTETGTSGAKGASSEPAAGDAKPGAGSVDGTVGSKQAAAASASDGTMGAGKAGADTSEAASSGGDKAGSASGKPPEEQTVELVYVLRDGKVSAVEVKTGLSDESNVEVLSGLKDGDVVVTGPYRTLRKLKHGEKATEKKEDEAPADTSKTEGKES